ncbi:DUF6153 family protein [Streptomyces sp. NPDC052225]|uniref:DUF6153 family protein n=1 Tax=Streptomyces sp. NPDC052225 TaxID=3154949 RepID=UPI003447B743
MTTPPAKGGTRRGRLLLFVALLLGIVGMHTLGHPTSSHADTEMRTGMTHAAPMHPVSPAPAAHEHEMPGGGHENGNGHGGMDPLSVCLAVLGSFTLLLLTAAVLRPLTAAGALRPAPRGLTYAHRPNPPPPRTLLSRLSVLRI